MVLKLKKQNHFSSFFLCSADTLGGHLDDMEADWSKPIVSLRYLSIPPFLFSSPAPLCFASTKIQTNGAKTMLGPDSISLVSSVWAAKLFSFWEESLERILH